jgi:outer membrane receptor protein involved in Fe transport
MRKRLLASASVVAVSLLWSAFTWAQTTGTIEGTVTDQNGGTLPGATVEGTSPNLQGSRTATTGPDGRYRFVSLPPGSYKVTANLSGFGAVQKNATVNLDSTATVNLQMQLATKESVTVTGEAPLIDTASTTTGTNYSAKVIDKLPVGRNYASIVLSQPGTQQDKGETQGRALAISIYGTTSAENLFLIDGVNTTNVIKGFQGKAINTEFIQEVEVKTGGYQAEYGRATGGVINVVTKSGGNEFHGDGFGYYNSPGMSSKQKFQTTAAYSQSGDALNTPGNIITPQDRREGGVDLGGYALKDRIWFYGAFDRTLTDDNIQPLTGIVANQLFNQHLLSNLWSGKLTFNVAQGTTIVATAFADPQVNTGALVVPASLNPTSYDGRRDVGGTDYAGRANQLFGTFGILTAQYSHHVDRFLTSPQGTGVSEVVDRTPTLTGGPVVITGGYGEVFGPTINNQSKRNQYSGSFTGYVGNNEFKIGGDYQKDETLGSTYYTGSTLLEIRPCVQGNANNNCDLTKAPLFNGVPVFFEHRTFTASGSDFNPLISAPFDTPSKRTGLFLQDQFRVLPTLTVNAGVRWDQDETDKGNSQVAFKLKNEWAPRGGIVWDFVGDGTSKLYASAGRFYYSIPTDLNARVFTANTQVYNYNYSMTDIGTQDPTAPRHRLIQVGSFDGEPVDPALKAPYQDEYTLGVEKALDPTLSIGLKGTYRTLGRTVEDRCDLDYNDPLALGSTCAITNPGNGSPISNGAIKTCDTSANATDPNAGQCGLPGVALGPAKRIFRGIELTARKQFSQVLWMQASYLYSSLRGNYSGAIREGDGQTDPGINADYDYNQFLHNAYGNLELDRPHQFRLDTVYNAPFGLAVGLQAYVRSGVPTSRQGFYNQFYTTELFLDQRGSDGRLPVDYEANLSLAYNFNIGNVTVTPQLYVFNLLNRQTVTAIDERFNVFGSYITRVGSPFYGQAGIEPGKAGPDGTICPASSTAPCSDNPDYRKATARVGARSLRAALKISF